MSNTHTHEHLTPLDGTLFGADQPCFGCGPTHPTGFHLKFRIEGDEVVTTFTPRDQDQGPLGVMHGGLVTTLADEVAAWAIIALKGKFGFTGALSCRFRAPVRVGVPVEARARIAKDGSRLLKIEVRMRQNFDDCFFGDFSFVVLDRKKAEELMGKTIPEEWARFCK